jgi:hypothetical protein
MKATILLGSLVVIIGSILYVTKPTNAIGSGIPQTENKLYSTNIVVECPVAVTPINHELEFIVDDNGVSYDHCHDCNTGVFLPSKEGGIRCTFCGKVK